MTNLRTPDILVRDTEEIDIARLGSIPHGNAFVAMGAHKMLKDAPVIPQVNGLPIGRFEDLSTPAYDFETDCLIWSRISALHPKPVHGECYGSRIPGVQSQ